MGTAPDGLIEAVYMPSRRFLWGVQWHPEFSFRSDEKSREIFRALVAAAES
jgi:putative glutamine amidotransferase